MTMLQEPKPAADARRPQWIVPIAVSLMLVTLTTALLWLLDARLDQQHLIFVYFVPTALIAIRYGSISAMGVTIACSGVAAYLLYPPHFSFLVSSPRDILELVLFCMLALLASQVVSGFASDRDVEKRRRRGPRGALLSRIPSVGAWIGRERGQP
jgi:K+-sensing histidine kinase KdpD